MNDFIVSAIKYRPATFQSVVGQPAITATLKNAIVKKHLAHAYLFCGPRGVGKTTCARILAKTLNCSNLTEQVEPCNQCESCKAFNENRSYNIHELDAASNNSVDDIRALTDKVRIPPQLGDYSVYIIDEVHMLSSSAFNAFLKTLEEPPKHAVFILATTEKHKILPTILSRCQIFDFNRIRVEDIVAHLQYVATQEGVNAESEALNVIALKADGAMRDALSIFDQIVSFSGNEVTYQKTIENLNVLDYDYYFQMVDAMQENKAMDALLLFNTILEKGFDAQYFLNGFGTHLRDLLVSQSSKTLILLEVGESVKEKYQQQAKRCTATFLFEALDVLNAADMDYRGSRNKRLLVELTLLKLCSLSKKKINKEDTSPKIAPITVAPTAEKESKEITDKTEKVSEKELVVKEEAVEDKKENILPKTTSVPTVSIKMGLNKEPSVTNTEVETAKDIPEENIGEDSYTAENVSDVLRTFIKEKHADSRTRATLTTYPPILAEGNVIQLKVSNALEVGLVEKCRKDLLIFLQKTLNNKNITLGLLETQKEDVSIKAMGQTDKLNYLMEKNPSVKKLKTVFRLEFD